MLRRRRIIRVAAVAAATLISLAGCAVNAENGTASSTDNGGNSELVSPLFAAIEEMFGHSLDNISWAAERVAAEKAAQCMRNQGWEYDHRVPEKFDPLAIPQLTEAAQVRQSLEEWAQESGDSAGDTSASDKPPDFSQDENTCWQNAYQTTPDPVSEAMGWLSAETQAIYDRVAIDPRYVEAAEQKRRCIADAGYDPDQVDQLKADLADRALAIQSDVTGGVLDLNEAYSELELLDSEERAIAEPVDECESQRLQIEAKIAYDLERQWLSENESRIAATIADLKDQLDALTEELAIIERDS